MADVGRWISYPYPWNHATRERNLPLIVNNAPFLIRPWVRVPHLASMILARAARELPLHWEEHYAIRPVLRETFVEIPRFRGTCYRAANWIYLGHTQGRGSSALPAGKVF